MLNRFPLWKNILLVLVFLLALIYALPNLYGEDPSVQISGNTSTAVINTAMINQIQELLTKNNIPYKKMDITPGYLLIRFKNTDNQFKALSLIKPQVGSDFTVAVNLASATPRWLKILNAQPMKKGLDLQGGIHFLLEVDLQSVVAKHLAGMAKNIGESLRAANIHYVRLSTEGNDLLMIFGTDGERDLAYNLIRKNEPNLQLTKDTKNSLVANISSSYLDSIRQNTLEQTLTTLHNRVNELGISEPQVQQQGSDRISVDLPGVQDSAQAKQILGGTATLEFHLVDEQHSPNSSYGLTGSRVYHMTDGTPILLQNAVVLSGDSITSATANYGEDGRPSVDISLGGGGESHFNRITSENIGHRMAIVYVETKTVTQMVNGKPVKQHEKIERVISAPVIQSALGAQFQITGITDDKEARNLALLLRAGAMPANLEFIEERTVGASLGQENIQMGAFAVEVGFALIAFFMIVYYRLFGLVADIALALNLLLIVAILSILGATLTLPGIAAIALTVGTAVDSNVLIFERIREELRLGIAPQSAIHAGFERAFATIVDANVTTLIVAIVLFGMGSGPIKGFAVTLTIGLLTSMFTAVTFTRGLVNALYGGRSVKQLSIGIRVKRPEK